MQIAIISLFPDMFDAIKKYGITKRAYEENLIDLQFFNPRDYSRDKHKRVDDRPFGGGAGMVMTMQPLVDAMLAAKQFVPKAPVIYLSPQGKTFTQKKAAELSKHDEIILLAGRYEGIDQRFIDHYVDQSISIGDYVLTGGELPVMVIIDAMTRLLPGCIHPDSVTDDSFSSTGNQTDTTDTSTFLDYPSYTRPAVYKNIAVPDVLLSGDHKKITAWRQEQKINQTQKQRPDLFDAKYF